MPGPEQCLHRQVFCVWYLVKTSRTPCLMLHMACCSSFMQALRIGGQKERPRTQYHFFRSTFVRSKFFTFAAMMLSAFALITFNHNSAIAQEGEAQVVDEVIAQVNDDVITLSMLNREIRER